MFSFVLGLSLLGHTITRMGKTTFRIWDHWRSIGMINGNQHATRKNYVLPVMYR